MDLSDKLHRIAKITKSEKFGIISYLLAFSSMALIQVSVYLSLFVVLSILFLLIGVPLISVYLDSNMTRYTDIKLHQRILLFTTRKNTLRNSLVLVSLVKEYKKRQLPIDETLENFIKNYQNGLQEDIS